MSKVSIVSISAILLVVILWLLYGYFSKTEAHFLIRDKADFNIEVVDDLVSMSLGLSGRESLDPNAGMLFVYTKPGIRRFWMKGMNFPLDFIWIRGFEVIGVHENIPHPEANEGEIYRLKSPEPADMILEVNAGVIAQKAIKIGDRINIGPGSLKVYN